MPQLHSSSCRRRQVGGWAPCPQVELAAAARRNAIAALEADPDSDLAYHLLGRWHSEMAQAREAPFRARPRLVAALSMCV